MCFSASKTLLTCLYCLPCRGSRDQGEPMQQSWLSLQPVFIATALTRLASALLWGSGTCVVHTSFSRAMKVCFDTDPVLCCSTVVWLVGLPCSLQPRLLSSRACLPRWAFLFCNLCHAPTQSLLTCSTVLCRATSTRQLSRRTPRATTTRQLTRRTPRATRATPQFSTDDTSDCTLAIRHGKLFSTCCAFYH